MNLRKQMLEDEHNRALATGDYPKHRSEGMGQIFLEDPTEFMQEVRAYGPASVDYVEPPTKLRLTVEYVAKNGSVVRKAAWLFSERENTVGLSEELAVNHIREAFNALRQHVKQSSSQPTPPPSASPQNNAH